MNNKHISQPHFKSPKSQLEHKTRHKNLYKTSPNWQQIYKKQCLSRLKEKRNESRSRLTERFRNIDLNDDSKDENKCFIDEVMTSVWNECSHYRQVVDTDITEFMEQIRQELLLEESKYWEELMEWRRKEELEWLVSNRESVVCFFCQKHPLVVNGLNDTQTQLLCSNCGFHFMAQSSFSLSHLQERVDSIATKHSLICMNGLKFNLINDCSNSGSNNIMVFCDVCRLNDLIFKNINHLT